MCTTSCWCAANKRDTRRTAMQLSLESNILDDEDANKLEPEDELIFVLLLFVDEDRDRGVLGTNDEDGEDEDDAYGSTRVGGRIELMLLPSVESFLSLG